MTEIIRPPITEGPLDTLRWVISEAVGLDLFAHQYIVERQSTDAINDELAQLDAINPLVGQEVDVWGAVLTPTQHIHGNALPKLTDDGTATRVRGIYKGLRITLTFDPEAVEFRYRVTHRVDDSSFVYLDDSAGDSKKGWNILAHDSAISPTLPINAHSLVDLRGDRFVERINMIDADDDLNRLEKIKHAAGLIGELLTSPGHYGDELTRQRISYLNSMGHLRGFYVSTSDFMLCRRPLDRFSICNGTLNAILNPRNIWAEKFEVASGYERLKTGLAVAAESPQLYLTAEASEERVFVIPINGIERIV
jgi:hypothetical protein